MCMSGGRTAPAPAAPAPAPSAPLPPAQQHSPPAATPNGIAASDPRRPRMGDRRARENARFANGENPNTRRSDTGGITM